MQPRHRLRKQADFQRVRQSGRSWAHPLVILAALKNELEWTRVGFSVSHRVGKAVQRNRARRLLREAMRAGLPRLQPGWDLVLIARPPIAGVTLQPVAEALNDLFRRASLLRDSEVGNWDSSTPQQGTPRSRSPKPEPQRSE